MITSLDKLKEFLTLNKSPYWTLYKGTTKDHANKVSEVDHSDTNVSMANSLHRLEQVFSILGTGRYTIVAKTKHDDIKAGVYTENVDISQSSQAAINGLGGNAVIGLTKEDVQEAINREREKWHAEQTLAKLQEEIKELKKQGPVEKIIAGLAPALEPILVKGLAKIAGIDFSEQPRPSVSVNGFNEPEQATMEEVERIQAAIEKLSAFLEPKGHNVVDVLEKLAEASEQKPDMIMMALKML
jgi:hypothetical protein